MNWCSVSLTFLSCLYFSINVNSSYEESEEFLYGYFPPDFIWGVGTSSYQIEGAKDAEGKGENIWDNFTHQTPSRIRDGSNGDIACDSYNKYEEDVRLLENIGVDFYRFSISWARILPDGITKTINQAGLHYYGKLIDLLIHRGITPVITIHHWDLPQELQNSGGWLNDEIIEHFGNFARLLYHTFGDRVKKWFTFNEAWVICVMGYGDGVFAPGIREMSESPYICIHNILKAHARAYRIYQEEFKAKQKGYVGITIDSPWYQPLNPNNTEDVKASQRALHFQFGMIANPIVFGDYPEIMKKSIKNRSLKEGRSTSRLPTFDSFWSDYVKGSYDFLGLNHYTTFLIQQAKEDVGPGWYGDQKAEHTQDPNWPHSGSEWLKVVPWGIRKVMNWIKDTYNNPPILISENGYSDSPNVFVNDGGRILYYKGYINNVLKALMIDGCNVIGYSAWSLMDNFGDVNMERFGLYWVNFTDPQRQRLPKKSVTYLRNIFLSNGFPYPRLPWGVGQTEGNDNQCDATKPRLKRKRKSC